VTVNKITDIYALAWNEGEEPERLTVNGTEQRQMEQLQNAIRIALETRTYGKISATRGSETISLYYRAWTDPQRGRYLVTGLDPADAEKQMHDEQKRLAVKCFTPRELYALKPYKVHHDLYPLIYLHLENEIPYGDVDTNAAEAEEQIEIRVLADECEDGRRTWTLETVWFCGNPVMVVNSSGRDGDEYHNRYITDLIQFENMLKFLRAFCKNNEIEGLVIDLDKTIPDMTEFYNATLHDYYDVEKQEKRERTP
jgi:hypothetical protein